MRHGPANALDPALVARLGASLDEAERSGRPLVLTGNDRFFSAGLDLAGLPEDRDEMGAFVDAFDEFVRRLFLFPCPTVAAVNGHAVAGGAILATACDVRIGAAGSYRIGVSEVQLGVIFPGGRFRGVAGGHPGDAVRRSAPARAAHGTRGGPRERLPPRTGRTGSAVGAGGGAGRRAGRPSSRGLHPHEAGTSRRVSRNGR